MFVRSTVWFIMATQSLVVSRDPEILGVLRPLMSELGISFEVCDRIPSAIQRLSERKFDNVIVDCDEADSLTDSGIHLLASLRQQANKQKRLISAAA